MVIFFSGTGNSRFCAEKIAAALGEKIIDSADLIKKGEKALFTSETPWIFVAPTYAWQIPHLLEELIKKGEFKGSKDAYFVMTCGGEIGNAGVKLEKLCKSVGFNYKGALEVVMPENYIAMFSVPDEEESEKIIADARPVLEKGIEIIKRGAVIPPKKASLADKIKSGPVNTLFYALCVSAKKFYATDSCISCGKCAKDCPTNCITIKDGKPLWGKGCTHCMACICGCPTEAIEYGKESIGKRRYMFKDE